MVGSPRWYFTALQIPHSQQDIQWQLYRAPEKVFGSPIWLAASVNNFVLVYDNTLVYHLIVFDSADKTKEMNLGIGKHFIPNVQEANQAVSLGTVVIIILVLFLSLIVILDLSTLQRDLRLMNRNVRVLRKWFKNH